MDQSSKLAQFLAAPFNDKYQSKLAAAIDLFASSKIMVNNISNSVFQNLLTAAKNNAKGNGMSDEIINKVFTGLQFKQVVNPKIEGMIQAYVNVFLENNSDLMKGKKFNIEKLEQLSGKDQDAGLKMLEMGKLYNQMMGQ
jgi:hypothetical protein